MKLEWGENRTTEVTWVEHDDVDAPVVVIWPAFGTPATYYRHLTPALREAGISSLVVEYPGRERADGITRETNYGYDDLATRVHRVVMAHVRDRHPRSRVVLLGHSLGGHVALFAAALARREGDETSQPESVILAASANPYWRGYGWQGFPRSFLGTAFMTVVSRGVGYWPGDRLRFWGRQSRVLVSDWSRIARTGRIQPQGAHTDYGEALQELDAHVLAISLPDDAFAPVGALDELLRLIPQAKVRRWHSPLPLGHIQWVRRYESILPIITDWVLNDRRPAPAHD